MFWYILSNLLWNGKCEAEKMYSDAPLHWKLRGSQKWASRVMCYKCRLLCTWWSRHYTYHGYFKNYNIYCPLLALARNQDSLLSQSKCQFLVIKLTKFIKQHLRYLNAATYNVVLLWTCCFFMQNCTRLEKRYVPSTNFNQHSFQSIDARNQRQVNSRPPRPTMRVAADDWSSIMHALFWSR